MNIRRNKNKISFTDEGWSCTCFYHMFDVLESRKCFCLVIWLQSHEKSYI